MQSFASIGCLIMRSISFFLNTVNYNINELLYERAKTEKSYKDKISRRYIFPVLSGMKAM